MNKKLVAVFICTLLLFISMTATASSGGYSWYFKPKNGGSTPELCPEADFVKNHNVVSIGKENGKKIYLTFDAGYENGNVEKILDILKENDVRATFFLLPRIVENNTELCKRMKEEGHLVGNHTVHHKNMGKVKNLSQ